MKRNRLGTALVPLALAGIALLASLGWSAPLGASGLRAAERPTVVPAPTDGPSRPALCPAKADAPPVRCSQQRAAPHVCLRLLGAPADDAPNIVVYQLAALNSGRTPANEVRMRLPIDPAQLALIEAAFSAPGAWVSASRPNGLEIRLGPLQAGAVVTATLRLRLAEGVATGSRLAARAQLLSGAPERGAVSNGIALVVGQRGTGAPAQLSVEPLAGPPGTVFHSSYEGFASNEHVGVWYHRPDGSIAAYVGINADNQGRTAFSLRSAGLAPGRYWLVAQGECSRVVAASEFVVEARP